MANLNAAWLKQLAPDHAPAPSGWWPLAPGWWVLLVLLIGILAIWVYRYRRKSSVLSRAALQELLLLENKASDDVSLARELQNLLRRYALAKYGHVIVANLSGKEWLAFVIEHGGKAFAGETGASFLRIAYGGQAQAERDSWLNGARAFLRWRK
jgi:hypothetical protein